MYSDIALKLYLAVKNNIIKSNAMFWKNYSTIESIQSLDLKATEEDLKKIDFNIICVFDDNFPKVNAHLKNSDKPFLLAYYGDINLLKCVDNNIAVVGVLTPTEDIIKREQKIVSALLNGNKIIVSGLAKGCDTVAHNECVKNKSKTIAFLPTTLHNIYPKENILLSKQIVENGGLIITEYVNEPANKYESIHRFIQRDRLQALYSKAVILIASYTKGNGDSGSRHSLKKAKEYGKHIYVMYNTKIDDGLTIMQLNKEEINNGGIQLNEKIIMELVRK